MKFLERDEREALKMDRQNTEKKKQGCEKSGPKKAKLTALIQNTNGHFKNKKLKSPKVD